MSWFISIRSVFFVCIGVWRFLGGGGKIERHKEGKNQERKNGDSFCDPGFALLLLNQTNVKKRLIGFLASR